MDQEAGLDPRFALKLDAGRALPGVIEDKLRALIAAGTFKPTNKLPNESELARNMGVARSSVRTALQRLETLELLEVKRGIGWYVRRTPPRPAGDVDLVTGREAGMADLFELRIGLEGLAASLAAVRATDGEIEDIAKLNQAHFEAVEDRDRLLETDEAFHEAIVRATRNELLIQSYLQIIGHLAEWRYDSYSVPGVPRRSAREHAKVVRYLRNHDPGGARAAMNAHLQRLYDELPDIREEPLDSMEIPSDAEPEWRDRAGPI